MLSFLQRALSSQPSAAPELTYAVQGMSPDASVALRGILKVLAGRTRHTWEAGAASHAAVLIRGSQFDAAQEANINSGQHIIRVTLSDEFHGGDVTRLEYPFRVFQVLSALQEVEAKLDSGNDFVPFIATLSSWALFDSLRQLANETSVGRWLVAHYPDGRPLYIRDDLCEFAGEPSVHSALIAEMLPQEALKPCTDPDPSLIRGRGRELLWYVGMHSGRGRMSGTLDPDSLYRLQAWPDFGVLRPQAAHLRLSALLASRSHSRDQLLHLLGKDVDVQVVNRFLNACAASGLLQVDGRATQLVLQDNDRSASSFVSVLVASIREKLGFGRRGAIGS